MKDVEIIDGHKVGDGYTWAQFRTLHEPINLVVNEESDPTDFMRMHFQNVFADYSEKFPTLYHVQVIKNKNYKITKDNALLDLTIPILPVGYMTDDENDYEKLITHGSPEEIQNENDKISKEEYNRRIKINGDEALNYFLFSIAERYYIAMQNNDEKTMSMLKNLKVFKEINFDFDSFEKLKSNKPVDLNFTMAYKTYLDTQAKYDKLQRIIKDYREYEVRQELEKRKTVHSNQPKNSGRIPSAKPSEPGDK